jgi:hypothetical protein
MAMNPGLEKLQLYPFQRLAQIKVNSSPPKDSAIIDLSIGEPQLETPQIIQESLKRAISGIGKYPSTRGTLRLRESMSSWATKRFNLGKEQLLPDRNILPVSGTREALFSIAQTLVAANSAKSLVGLPNPFYQIYEGAAILAGATPYYFNGPAHNNFIPLFEDTPEKIWQKMSFMYICSPGNPAGNVMTSQQYDYLINYSTELNTAVLMLQQTTQTLLAAMSARNIDLALSNSVKYLELFGHIIIAWLWLKQGLVATKALEKKPHQADEHFYRGKLQALKYFYQFELPQIYPWSSLLINLDSTSFDMKPEWF